jgi:amino acid adenylation domain-containing protein
MTWPSMTEGEPGGDGACVHRLIEAQAAARPGAVAVVGLEGVLSYAELEQRAAHVAGQLISLGLGREDVVGLAFRSGVAAVVAALGVLKAGAAYLPIDPDGPPDRTTGVLADASARVVICADDAPLAPGPWRMVRMNGGGELVHAAPSATRANAAGSSLDDLAYVIYTSGSTGRPKGVQATHANLLHLVRWHQQAFAVTPADCASQMASLSFDAAVWEIWPYLAAGASLHIVDPGVRANPSALRDWLLAHRITIGFVPTMIAERLIELSWPERTDLRVLLTGADTLRHYPPAGLPFVLVNNYGPTECTVVATSGRVPEGGVPDRPPTIGRAISGARIHILDEHRRPLPTGTGGEIWIGGAGVARGYLGQPELTAQRFIPDPFSDRPGARLYATGDRGRLLPDGEVAFLGRADDQVKVRGYRVEPGEVAFALDRHPAIVTSFVTAREASSGDAGLMAYVVLADGIRPTPSDLHAFLSERLPIFMLPARFVVMPSLPLNPNGKVDRAALPAPETGDILRDEDPAAGSVLEGQVAALLAELLAVDRIGSHDNFFHLGGHSLLAAQVIAHVSDRFGVELPLRTIFDHPTAGQLAAEIEGLVLAKIGAMREDPPAATIAAPGAEEARP